MKKNILPFGIIAIVGIFAAIIIFYVGVHQREDMQQAEENGGEATENGDTAEDDAEGIFASNCATCHGDDMSGGAGPDLTKIGSELSEDDILDVIDNGKGSMPAGIVQGEEAATLAAWLSEHDGESSDDNADDNNDADDNNNADNNDDNDNADASSDAGEEAFANSCASCHGDDLSGGVGPDLTTVGGDLSEDEILDIIDNGKGSMPAGVASGSDAEAIAAWLSEMK